MGSHLSGPSDVMRIEQMWDDIHAMCGPGSWNPKPRIVKVWAENEGVFKVAMEGGFSPKKEGVYGPSRTVEVTVTVQFDSQGSLRWTPPSSDFWTRDHMSGGLWRHHRRIGKFAVAMGYPNPECLFKSFKDDPRPIYLSSYLPPPTLWEHLDDEVEDCEWRVCPDVD